MDAISVARRVCLLAWNNIDGRHDYQSVGNVYRVVFALSIYTTVTGAQTIAVTQLSLVCRQRQALVSFAKRAGQNKVRIWHPKRDKTWGPRVVRERVPIMLGA